MTRASDYYRRLKADPERYEVYLKKKRDEAKARKQVNPDYDAARKRRWRLQQPEYSKLMRSVNFAVHRAVRDGKLVRPNACEKCGKKCKPEAHHFKGYAKQYWLVVEWLCRKCHMGVHHG